MFWVVGKKEKVKGKWSRRLKSEDIFLDRWCYCGKRNCLWRIVWLLLR